MNVGLPRRRQRDLHPVSDIRSQRPYIARPRDLHHIRTEISQQSFQLSVVSKEKQIIVMRPVEGKFHRAAWKLNSSQWSRGKGLISPPGMHHQKRQVSPSRKGLEMPARLRYSIHFMVDARKKRNPWTGLLHVKASDETASVETASAAMMSGTISCANSGTAPRLNIALMARCTIAFSSSRIPDKIRST